MAKKRRNVTGPLTQRTPTATTVNHEAIKNTLQKVGTYFDQLSDEIMEIPTTLERTILLHSLVALAVQNALIIVQTVSLVQVVSAVGIAVWMMRKSFVRLFLPRVALIAGSDLEISFRGAIVCLTVVGLAFVFCLVEVPLNAFQVLAFAVAFLLDAVMIYLMKATQGRFTRQQIFLSAVEATYLVTGLPICVNFRKEWVYDSMAFALTATTAFVHVGVLLTAKHVILNCFGLSTSDDFTRTKERGVAIMEQLWLDVESCDSEQMLVGNSKKKKNRSKLQARFLKTDATDHNTSELQNKHSNINDPHVRLAMLTLVQIVLLLLQFLLSAFVLYSWEMISALMLSSSHVLWILGRVRRNLLSPRTVGSESYKLKKE
ncbi:uncharacterized protein PHALS_14075 [Plasmopara halstedii]|uniref:Uncharacterized protein n=1 Tax=Plasmopara halstedii TaxID=4781 RepID=A0A0P1AQG1_PLAHL|nr:uncharacterized protein PHALS_14075 [Plasmopara halstedii]CEG43783.1 hypothetical protein PHALS_14075 [Plasmopara halstedii]|eukprot:XP_024580152.1 hypothetical protein PHALS_14075 [Plasmopara halstedii]